MIKSNPVWKEWELKQYLNVSSLRIIMAINTFARKEIKFLLNMHQYENLIEEIDKYMNPDKFCIDGKEYGVYNIYYDTFDDFLIRESLSKPYYKESKFTIKKDVSKSHLLL